MCKRPMCLFFFAFLAGVIFAYTGRWILGLVFAAAILYRLADLVYLLKKAKKPPGKRKKCLTELILILTVTAAAAGYGRGYMSCRNAGWYETADLDEERVKVSGIIYAKGWKETSYAVYLKETSIFHEDKTYMGNRILLRTYLGDSDSESETQSLEQYKIGQRIEATGRISYFDVSRNPGNFDMRSYYQLKGIDFALNLEESSLLDGGISYYQEFLYDLKERVQKVYMSLLSEEEYGLLSTMILGDDSLLNEETENLYQKAGISHILAISGLHISVLGMSLYQFLRKRGISYGFSGILSFFLIFSYSLMSGMAVSSQRALLMFGLLLLANERGRAYDSLSALAFAGLFILLENPLLCFTASFQLSFAAVAGAVLFPPVLKELWGVCGKEKGKEKKKGEKYKDALLDSFFLCLGIQLSTMPIVLYYFFEIPLYSILVNLLILPLLSALLLLGILGGFSGLLSLSLSRIFLLPDWLILTFYHRVCVFFQRLPASSLVLGRPSAWKILLYYLLLAGLYAFAAVKRRRREEEEKKGLEDKSRKNRLVLEKTEEKAKAVFQSVKQKGKSRAALACFLLGLLLLLKLQIPLPLQICMLDVGQGDGILLRTGSGLTCFIDGGSTDVKRAGKYRLLPFLKSEGIGEIEYWFLSHTDADHMSAMEEAMEAEYPVKCLVLAEGMVWDEKAESLIRLAEEKGTRIYQIGKGDILEEGALSISCVYPPDQNAFTDKNDASMVLSLQYWDFKMLFTGDVSSKTESELIGKRLLSDIDVLKVAHHGSATSSSRDFLKAVKAEAALISVGEDNSYGHPAQETLERLGEAGCKIYRTDQEGMIRISVYRNGYVMTDYLENDKIPEAGGKRK